jgi:hypothetical protein
MAIFYCQTTPLSRSAGRSAVAAAAYRSGSELVDERTGLVHDYERRSGVESADLVLPPDAPTLTRGEVWNQAEAAEIRKDGRTAREWVIALPDELGPDERRALTLEFAATLADRYRVGVDVAIHKPGREGDQRNHHAHLLTTTRQIGPDGFGAKADIELSDKARAGRGLPAARTEIEAVRGIWAGLANTHLEHAGRVERIDHRSLKAQGIEREPTRKLGPAATAVERRTKAPSRRRQGHEAGAIERQAAAQFSTALEREAAEIDTEIHAVEVQRQGWRQQLDALAKMPPAVKAHQEPEAPTQIPGRGRRQNFGRPAPEPAAPPTRTPGKVQTQELPEAPPKPLGQAPAKDKDPEQVYTAMLKPLERKRQQAAAAAIEALRTERKAWQDANHAHEAAAPGRLAQMVPGRQAAWEKAGAAFYQSGRDLSERETAARQAAHPETIQRAAREELRRSAPAVVERADAARQKREALERERRQREQVEKAAVRERERVAEDFKSLALGRELRMFGHTDTSEKWKEMPAELKDRIEAYIKLPKERRPADLERIAADPQAAKLLKEAREISRSQSRGR